MRPFALLKAKLQMKHQPAHDGSDSEMSLAAAEVLEEVTAVAPDLTAADAGFVSTVANTAFFYYNQIPPSVDIAPVGEVKTSFIAFFIAFATLGWFYKFMWRVRIGQAKHSNGSSRKTIRPQSAIYQGSKNGSRSVASSKFDNVGTGFKEEVYEFMDTCATVKGQLRHVDDPDRARTLKLQLLTKEAPDVLGTPASTCSDHEDTSESSATNHNELVELCLDVRKGLHRVQDPDEARKMKLQRLKEQEVWKSAADIRKQHEQAGFTRMWKPS